MTAEISERIERLRSAVVDGAGIARGHLMLSEEEERLYAELAFASYSASFGRPEASRRAEFLESFACEFPADIREAVIAGGEEMYQLRKAA